MYVRTTVIDAEPTRVDHGVAFIRDRVRPLLAALEGSRGVTFEIHRPTGRSVLSTLWGARAAMTASRRLLASVREEAANVMGGATALAEEWEVAELYRAQPMSPGFTARTTRLSYDSGDAESLVDTFRTTTVPSLSLLDGFASAELVIDLDAGSALTVVTFQDLETLEASRRAAAEIRQVMLDKARAKATEVLETEVAICELHLPDQA